MNNITLTVALLPTIVIMVIVTKNARAAKEPFKKLAKVFAMSALSVIPAAILELIGEKVLDGVLPAVGIDADGTFAQQALAMLIKFTFIVGIAEECCKYFTFKIMMVTSKNPY